jgi:8-oxo-dGTP diphosphatase
VEQQVHDKPEQEMAPTSIRVVAAVIQQDGKYLITQRRENASLPLLWEFPGGRVEPGETDAQALQREFSERLGAPVEVGKPVAFRRHDYEGYTVELVLYEAKLVTTESLEAIRVKEYRWVAADEFGQYPFPPADRNTMDDISLFTSRGKPKKPPMA